jgi:hypothetical protein
MLIEVLRMSGTDQSLEVISSDRLAVDLPVGSPFGGDLAGAVLLQVLDPDHDAPIWEHSALHGLVVRHGSVLLFGGGPVDVR